MTRADLVARTATTLARVLLLLYPPSFRNDVGTALVGDVRRRAKELTGSRAGIRVGVWLVRLGTSLLVNAFAAWGEKMIPGWRRDQGRRRARSDRRSWTFSWLDLKLAFRMLVKYPGLTLIGGLGIAVAIAIGVGFFALFHSRFYPTIPLSEGERLVGLQNWDVRTSRQQHRSLHDFVLWREEMKSVEDMTAFRTVARNVIAADGSVEGVHVAEMTPSGFRLARVPPMLGRSLLDADAAPGASPVIVIGFDVWRSRFASAPDIVGRHLRLGRTVHTVVGVMPDGFAFPVNHRYWIPLTADPSEYKRDDGPSIFISGRLAPGFDLAGAHAELTVIGNRIAAAFPDTHQYLRPEVLPYTYSFAGMNRNSSDDFWPMSLLVSLLLVVVCVNVAILIYARTATRLGEIAVRSALGASRGRIVAQLFAESLVLSAGAAAVGLAVVKGGTRLGALDSGGARRVDLLGRLHAARDRSHLLRRAHRARRGDHGCHPRASRDGPPRAVRSPSVQQRGQPAHGPLVDDAHRRAGIRRVRRFAHRGRPGLVPGSGRLQRTQVPRGADPVRRSGTRSGTASRTRRRFVPDGAFRALREPANGVVPEARSRSGRRRPLVHVWPPQYWRLRECGGRERHRRVRGGATRDVQRSTVDLNFFRTFDVDLLAGRPFRSDDRGENSADVIVVNRAFTVRVLGDGEALGRRVRYVSENPGDPGEPGSKRWYEIVGVVENIDANPFGHDLVDPRVYHPMKNVEGSGLGLAVRVAEIEHGALARRLPVIAAALDPTLRVDVVPLGEGYRLRRLTLSTAALAIGVALLSVILLSAAGIYALMSFTVAQRRREIAIRTALGAQPGRLLGGIFGQALRQIAIGVAIGVGVALFIDAAEHGEALGGRGGLLLSGTALVMSAVGLLATLGPARRGLRIEPSEALKGE